MTKKTIENKKQDKEIIDTRKRMYYGGGVGGLGALGIRQLLGSSLRKDVTETRGGGLFSKDKTVTLKNLGALFTDPKERGLIKSFLEKHDLKDLRMKGAKFLEGPMSDYYNHITHGAHLPSKSTAVSLHELGHAADIRGSMAKTFGRALTGGMLGMLVPAAILAGKKIKEKHPDSIEDKVLSFVNEHPYLTTTSALTIPTLYPEAKASLLALKHIAEKDPKALKDSTKILGKAYGTYLSLLLPALGAVFSAKHFEKKKPLEK